MILNDPGMFLALGAVFLYFLPAANAYWRGHHNAEPILIINLLLGWTFIGWVAALAWSSSATVPRETMVSIPPPRPARRVF
jgi:T4 superinfection immunity protein